jgi:hypothetical protein
LLSSANWTTFNNKQNALVAGTDYLAPNGNGSSLTGLTKSQVGLGSVSNALQLIAANNLSDLTDAGAARTNLGVAIGSNVQAFNAGLAQIAGLADPNADKLLFWDDSAGAYAYLTLGTNLSITDTTLNAAGGGGGTPGGSSGDIQYNDGGSFAGALLKQGSNLIEQRNGTNAQKLRVYNTYTASDNYNNILIDAGSNYGAIMMAGAGGSAFSGSVFYIANSGGSLQFQTNGNGRWNMSTAGHLLGNDDNSYDIGAAGATRPRSGYFGTLLRAPEYQDANGVKVLGTQGAAVADATGAGDVVAQLNFLLARCRAHGLIAT